MTRNKDQRIEEIIRVIQNIAAGNYASRINISGSKDEIDGIATGINMLSEEVENMIGELARENLHLQDLVNKLQITTNELNKSQELFRYAFHSSPDSVIISRMEDGLLVNVNNGFCQLSGFTREEVLGKKVFELKLWLNKKDREKLISELKKKGTVNNQETIFRRKDKQIRTTLLSAIVLMLDGIPHMLTIIRDITELIEIQKELRISKERYEDLIQTAPDGIAVTDSAGIITMVNKAFCKISGYSARELIDKHFSKFPGFISKRDILNYLKLFANLMKGNVTGPIETRWHNKSGSLITTEVHTSLIRKDNKIVGLQAIIRDITDRIRFIDALKSSEKQYRTSMDSMYEPLHLVNRKLEIILANKALINISKKLGFTGKIVGRKFYEAYPFLDKKVRDEYMKVFKSGKTLQKEEHFNFGGVDKHSYTQLIPIYEKKRVERILTVIQDITERKKAEKVRELMYSISNAVTLTKDLNELFHVIREELGKVFDTTNFFIALFNKRKDTLSLPYFIDEKDSFNEFPAKKTMTGYLLKNARPLLMKNEQIEKLVSSGEVENVGTPSKIWLGVPLKIKEEVIGALVVQHYENENAYTKQDLEILEFISNQIGLSIETKRAYDEVKVEKAYFEQLFESSPETIVLTDTDGRLLKVNTEFEKLFGYTAEDVLGKKIDDLIAPENYHEEALSISQRVGKGEKIIFETIRQDKNGNQIHVSVMGTPVKIGEGQVAVYGIYRNITEQKKAQLALKESEEKLRNILYSSPDAIIVVDLRGYITECNPAALELYGCSSMNEMIGMNANKLVSEKDKEKSIEGLKKVLKKGFVKNVELELIIKNGKKIFVEVSASLLKNAAGKPVGIVGVTKDLTERKNYEHNLELAKEKAEESDKLKSAFLANMSHEIRTPMNAILGFSELLKNEELTTKERDEYIKIIRNKGNELLSIINDIIDISKIEAGDIRIIPATFPINEFMNEIFVQFSEEKSMMSKENIQFRINIPEKMEPSVNTDRVRLKQIFNNLIHNAFKFTYEGYIEMGYEILDQSRLRFYVKDTGIGIPKEKQNIIFDRFRQVDESLSSQFGGTGLGLSISKNLAVLLDSDISVVSEPGQGSTFSFVLPIEEIRERKMVMQDIAGEKETDFTVPDLTGKCVLVVEDDSSNYLFIDSFLKRTQAQILWARDGIQAIDIFKNQKTIDLILMDIRMPNMNGIEATRKIRRINTKVPVIALTAYAFTNDCEKSLQAGCNDYLSKPVKLKVLTDILNKYFRKPEPETKV